MKHLLSVTIENSPKVFNYIIDKSIHIGEKVVVESERGITVAEVRCVKNLEENLEKHFDAPKIIRVASNKDLIFLESKKELECEAREYCIERIHYRGMKMKIVDVKYMLHSSKVIFYFTADGRVDFRNLVKDLASRLKSRIEMRQIGVRDQAQIVGGIGVCGRELCCHSFMGSFQPISLDDAKQNCSGNSDKVIGVCGRFMCCLKFEGDKDCSSCKSKSSQDYDPEKHNKNSKPKAKNQESASKQEASQDSEHKPKGRPHKPYKGNRSHKPHKNTNPKHKKFKHHHKNNSEGAPNSKETSRTSSERVNKNTPKDSAKPNKHKHATKNKHVNHKNKSSKEVREVKE